MKTGRIAFVDDDLDNYHTNVFLSAMRKELKDRGYFAAGCTALKEEKGRAWGERNGIPYFSDPDELGRNADFFMVLAPSSPGTHMPLCEKVLPFGRPVWVDKTFAPDLATAQHIFALADEHGAPVDTASALRYTAVQEFAREAGREKVRRVIAWCPGGKLSEYLVHPVEAIVSVLGPEAQRAMRRGADHEAQVLVDFSGGRTAVANVHLRTKTPYAAAVTTTDETRYIEVDTGKLFVDALAGVLDFFDRGKPTIDRKESLMIMRIIDAALAPRSAETWIPL